MMATQVRTVKK